MSVPAPKIIQEINPVVLKLGRSADAIFRGKTDKIRAEYGTLI